MSRVYRLLSSLAVVLLLTGSQAAAGNSPSITGKWRIVCNGGPSTEGTIEFRVTPHEGTPIVVTAKVPKGHSENAVARDIRDAFIAQLDKKRFHVETDDGEDVLVKRKGDQPKFLLELVSSGVQNVSLRVKHD
ncbi:MAG: hypothetical protein ABW034_23505 [Steroidobacteraceae bacterium]